MLDKSGNKMNFVRSKLDVLGDCAVLPLRNAGSIFAPLEPRSAPMPLMFFADDVDAEKLLRKAAEWGWNISGYRSVTSEEAGWLLLLPGVTVVAPQATGAQVLSELPGSQTLAS